MACFTIVVVLWVFSVCLHEFGHAIVAYRGGDTTVRDKGYLTMNPVHYTDPFTSLILPVIFVLLGGIGLPGGAVYIERHLLKSRVWDSAVSLAGPAMNALIVLVIAAGFWTGLLKNDVQSLASVSLAFVLFLQLSAIALNLLPVPPLDGFQAIAAWLPEETRRSGMAMSSVGFFVVFALLAFVQPVNRLFFGILLTITDLLGVDPYLVGAGWKAFRFWAN